MIVSRSRRVQRCGAGSTKSREHKMDKAWSVDAEPAPDFTQAGEHELAPALVDCTDACLGRPFAKTPSAWNINSLENGNIASLHGLDETALVD